MTAWSKAAAGRGVMFPPGWPGRFSDAHEKVAMLTRKLHSRAVLEGLWCGTWREPKGLGGPHHLCRQLVEPVFSAGRIRSLLFSNLSPCRP